MSSLMGWAQDESPVSCGESAQAYVPADPLEHGLRHRMLSARTMEMLALCELENNAKNNHMRAK